MSNYDGLVKRLLAGPWERHTDTGRVADDAPKEAAAAIMELQAERDRLFRKAALAEEWRDHDKTRAETAGAERDRLRDAGSALIDDVRRRYPGEELRCEFMRALDEALTRSA